MLQLNGYVALFCFWTEQLNNGDVDCYGDLKQIETRRCAAVKIVQYHGNGFPSVCIITLPCMIYQSPKARRTAKRNKKRQKKFHCVV